MTRLTRRHDTIHPRHNGDSLSPSPEIIAIIIHIIINSIISHNNSYRSQRTIRHYTLYSPLGPALNWDIRWGYTILDSHRQSFPCITLYIFATVVWEILQAVNTLECCIFLPTTIIRSSNDVKSYLSPTDHNYNASLPITLPIHHSAELISTNVKLYCYTVSTFRISVYECVRVSVHLCV